MSCQTNNHQTEVDGNTSWGRWAQGWCVVQLVHDVDTYLCRYEHSYQYVLWCRGQKVTVNTLNEISCSEWGESHLSLQGGEGVGVWGWFTSWLLLRLPHWWDIHFIFRHSKLIHFICHLSFEQHFCFVIEYRISTATYTVGGPQKHIKKKVLVSNKPRERYFNLTSNWKLKTLICLLQKSGSTSFDFWSVKTLCDIYWMLLQVIH